jgi:hypothetical protein
MEVIIYARYLANRRSPRKPISRTNVASGISATYCVTTEHSSYEQFLSRSADPSELKASIRTWGTHMGEISKPDWLVRFVWGTHMGEISKPDWLVRFVWGAHMGEISKPDWLVRFVQYIVYGYYLHSLYLLLH